MLQKMVSSAELPGTVRGRDYVPYVFSAMQRTVVVQSFKSEGYIDYARMKRLQVQTKPSPASFFTLTFLSFDRL